MVGSPELGAVHDLHRRGAKLAIDARARAGLDRTGQIVEHEDGEALARTVDGGGTHAEVARQPAHEQALDPALAQKAGEAGGLAAVVAEPAVGIDVGLGTFTYDQRNQLIGQTGMQRGAGRAGAAMNRPWSAALGE